MLQIFLYTSIYIFIYSIYVCAACEMLCAFNFILLHFTFTNSACATLFYRKYAPQIHTGNTHIVTICNYSVCVLVCVFARETDKANAIVEFLLPFAAVRAETENPPYFREALKCQREIFHKRYTAEKKQAHSVCKEHD